MRLLACVLLTPAMVLFYKFLLHVNVTTVALTFLLAVLVVSATWGFWYAALLAVLATLAFNFSFLPPFGTLTIADPQNWVALFAFLATAVIAGQLSERARREMVKANQRRREIEQLYAFSQRLLTFENVPELLNLIPSHIAEVFVTKASAMVVTDRPDIYRSGPDTRELDAGVLQLVAARAEQVIDAERLLAFVPLRLGVRSVGAIGISGATLSHESLHALSTLIAIAIERARAIESVAKAEALRESETLRSAILDSIAHEFRTPLTAIKASVTSLLAGSFEEAQQNELLTVINEESDRMNHLVEKATQLARLESKQVELDRAPNDIRKAIECAVEAAKKVLDGHPVEISASRELPLVEFDLQLIGNVLRQLLENAAKYSPPASPIHISVARNKTALEVSVADRGQGIEELEQFLIFDKFYRGKENRYSIQGTGMGLAIAKAVIEAHSGSIRVTSQIGHGSVFSFSLPLHAA
jgi:two-component system, OmpR family, sensor histidine kinase KdpD